MGYPAFVRVFCLVICLRCLGLDVVKALGHMIRAFSKIPFLLNHFAQMRVDPFIKGFCVPVVRVSNWIWGE